MAILMRPDKCAARWRVVESRVFILSIVTYPSHVLLIANPTRLKEREKGLGGYLLISKNDSIQIDEMPGIPRCWMRKDPVTVSVNT